MSHPTALISALFELLDLAPEDAPALRPLQLATYRSLGYDADADVQALESLVRATPLGTARLIVALGHHADHLIEAIGYGLDELSTVAVADEVALHRVAALRDSALVFVAMNTPEAPSAEPLLRLAAQLRPDALRVLVDAPEPYQPTATLWLNARGVPRLGRPVLLIADLSPEQERRLSSPGWIDARVRLRRTTDTLPPDLNQYGLVVVLSVGTPHARLIRQRSPETLVISVCGLERLAQSAWCIPTLQHALQHM